MPRDSNNPFVGIACHGERVERSPWRHLRRMEVSAGLKKQVTKINGAERAGALQGTETPFRTAEGDPKATNLGPKKKNNDLGPGGGSLFFTFKAWMMDSAQNYCSFLTATMKNEDFTSG